MIKLGRSLIKSMNGVEYSVRRSTAGVYVAGAWVESATTTVTVLASKQAVGGYDIQRLPEGDRTKQVIKLYSADELKIHDERTGSAADVITVDSIDYEVKTCEHWSSYWKAMATKVEDALTPDPEEA